MDKPPCSSLSIFYGVDVSVCAGDHTVLAYSNLGFKRALKQLLLRFIYVAL